MMAYQDSYTSFRGNKDASISEIHKFVKQIPHLAKEYKSVNHHIHIAGMLKRLTDARDFRELWQTERGILEGEVPKTIMQTYLRSLNKLFVSLTIIVIVTITIMIMMW